MTLKLIYFTCILHLFAVVNTKELPAFIKPCKRYSPDLNKCFIDVMYKMQAHSKKGIPEMGIPPIDPMVIEKLDLEQPEGVNLGFNATLTNLMFTGGSNFTPKKVNINLENDVFYLEINFPELKMHGNYEANGKVLLITFEGNGEATGTFTNVTLYATYNHIRVIKDNKEHLQVTDKTTKVDVGHIKVYFENIFNNNPNITRHMNKLINENTEILFKDIKPLVETTIGNIATEVCKNVNERFSLDDLFPIK